MKSKFALLTVLGALVALAVPTSSPAFMYPAGNQFEIAGGAHPPTLGTSLGSCNISKMVGTIPPAPESEGSGPFYVTVTPGTCTSGTTITMNTKWGFTTQSSPDGARIPLNAGAVTMRFSSLPGCKLSGNPILFGVWSNGGYVPKTFQSSYHATGTGLLTWSDDGATCSLSGQKEYVPWSQSTSPAGLPYFSQVTNLTKSTMPIILGS